jgi:hypothetical protein
MSILLKRASSSAWSLERSLRRRLALLDSRMLTALDDTQLQHPHTQPALPFGDSADDDDLADGEPSHVLGAPGLRSARIERAWLTLLIEASRNASRAESKPRALARILRRCREPALIYTEYRDTLTHLARTLPDRSSHAMLHGGLGANDRRAALARFTSGEARMLLTTDAAGEGLNLHHRCRLVINVELPWNPNRLEQRIGRVDRLGQTRTVHAIHFVAADTAEEPMLARLTGRVARIAAALGDAPAVLRASREFTSREFVSSGADADANAGADADMTRESCIPSAIGGDAGGGHRSVSTAAADVVVQLQRLRAMRARAWQIGRHCANRTPASRGDPLLALDERAPLIAVIRRRMRGKQARVEHDARRSRASPITPRRPGTCACRRRGLHPSSVTEPSLSAATECRLSGVSELCGSDSMEPRVSGAPELPGPGLICIWRTRVERNDGRAQARAGTPSQVLTVIHVACDVPSFTSRSAVSAFVTATLERCSMRIRPLLDNDLAAARERLRAMDRARVERLARRDDAIAAEMAAMLRARAAGGGAFQPLLFEDIAIEKTAMTGVNGEGGHTWAPGPLDASAGAADRVESTLVVALVLR